MTHLANITAFDRSRTRLMEAEIKRKQATGFTNIKTIPQHCVSANYNLTLRKFGYSPRHNRRINPFRLGFANKYVDTHFNLPYEAIFITEAQTYLNSRMSKYFPDWQSRWYEQDGHNNIDVWLDVQRPGLIDVNVRDLSQAIEIVKLHKEYDGFGRPCRFVWDIRRIDIGLCDRYIASGKKDSGCYTEDVVVANYNVFECYDSQSCKPKFYEGHFEDDFDYEESEIVDDTFDGYVDYLKKAYDEYQDKFYIKGNGKVA